MTLVIFFAPKYFPALRHDHNLPDTKIQMISLIFSIWKKSQKKWVNCLVRADIMILNKNTTKIEQNRTKSIENPWIFTFLTDLRPKKNWLRIGIWMFQDMLGTALDKISSFPGSFSCCHHSSKKFFGVKDRDFRFFQFWRCGTPYLYGDAKFDGWHDKAV